MKSHIEVMYDPRFHDGRAIFEKIIYDIQFKHSNWFQDRLNQITNEVPDKIYNHYRYYYDGNHEIALFLNDELPLEIRSECINEFNSIFKVAANI